MLILEWRATPILSQALTRGRSRILAMLVRKKTCPLRTRFFSEAGGQSHYRGKGRLTGC